MRSSTEYVQDSCPFQLNCSLIARTVPLSTREDTVVSSVMTKKTKYEGAMTKLMFGLIKICLVYASTLVYVLSADFACLSYHITFWKLFCIYTETHKFNIRTMRLK